MAHALLGLGANLGDRQPTLTAALDALAQLPETRVVAVSRWHETPPVGGPPGQPPYLNGAARLETHRAPAALLGELLQIETGLGRQRQVHWEPRPIDLDLLLYDQQVVDTAELQLPHPRMAFRRFVLEPAAEIAPDWRHPRIGWTLAQLLEHLNTALPYAAFCGALQPAWQTLPREVADQCQARWIELAPLDPDAPTADAALAWLDACAASVSRSAWPAAAAWSISPHWSGEALVLAARLPEEDRQRVEQRYRQLALALDVVPPKLLVVVDSDERKSWADAVQRCYAGPVLHLPADRPCAIDEWSAALVAMQ